MLSFDAPIVAVYQANDDKDKDNVNVENNEIYKQYIISLCDNLHSLDIVEFWEQID